MQNAAIRLPTARRVVYSEFVELQKRVAWLELDLRDEIGSIQKYLDAKAGFDETIRESIALREKVRRARKRLGLTIENVADGVGYSKAAICHAEKGRSPSRVLLSKVMDFLKDYAKRVEKEKAKVSA